MKIVVVSGGFDPIHSGHIELLKKASALGDMLIVGLNSDDWLRRKKGKEFMPLHERKKVLESIKWVDSVWEFDDSDGSACELLERIKNYYWTFGNYEIIFANGGDRTKENIPEMKVSYVTFVFGIGGEDKKNSSSWILQEWKAPKTIRPWGYYRVLHELPGMKVKELTVEPGKSLSMQRHFKRSEHWIVSEGNCEVNYILGEKYFSKTLNTHGIYQVPLGEWHQLCNPYDEPCRIVEVQYGEECVEEDIERK
jgi:cytidyltransferase-like protein